MPYPFNYFASIFNFRSSFANRKKLSWFQMIFTSFFLISITLLPVALQNAQLKTYPLTTFVSDVFDPLSTDVMKDIQEHVVIKDQELTYTGTNPVHKTSKGQVILGQEAKASEGKELTLHFDRKQLIISKENKELATISYQAINQESLRDKKSFTQAISSDWFRDNHKDLIRIPGIGVTSAKRIVMVRRHNVIKYEHLKKLGVVIKRAKYFITVNGEFMGFRKESPELIRNALMEKEKMEMQQLKLFNI